MAAKTSAWVGGTAVVAVLIAAGAYFVAINPTLSDAADQRQATSDQQDHNLLLQQQLDLLKKEYTHLDDYEADLAALRIKAPEVADLAELTRQVQSLADTAGVTLTVGSPGTPAAFVAPALATPEPTPSETTSSSDSSTDATATGDTKSSGSSGTAAVAGLFQIPISFTSIGTYDQTVMFLDSLQQVLPRLYVISEVDATALKEQGAQGGLPAVSDGDLSTVISGYVLTLQDGAAVAEPTDGSTPSPELTTLPVPGDQKNPFQPGNGS